MHNTIVRFNIWFVFMPLYVSFIPWNTYRCLLWNSSFLFFPIPDNFLKTHTVKLGYSNIGFCDTLSIASNIINIVVLIIQRYSFITTLFLGPFDDVITKFYCIYWAQVKSLMPLLQSGNSNHVVLVPVGFYACSYIVLRLIFLYVALFSLCCIVFFLTFLYVSHWRV
jgi:hypothetical protein